MPPESKSPLALAREAVELAEKATPGEWRCEQDYVLTRDGSRGGPPMQELVVEGVTIGRMSIYSLPGDGELCAHAGRSYVTVARAAIEYAAELARCRKEGHASGCDTQRLGPYQFGCSCGKAERDARIDALTKGEQ